MKGRVAFVCALTVACGDEPTMSAPIEAPAARTLFVGNSHTFINDLPALYVRLAKPPPVTDSVAYGGYTLPQHLADARGFGVNARLASLLGAADAKWDHVILQENASFIVGAHDDTVNAASALSGLAANAGAKTVLYMTWGYARPEYAAMQATIEATYRDVARAIASAGHGVVIAPVGVAFRTAYEREASLRRDPFAAGSPFMKLFDPDLVHASLAGTYVAACVVTATIYGVDPTTFDGDVEGLDAATKLALQTLARDAIAAEKTRP